MDKTSMTLGWLVGRQIAGQRRTQEKQPIAYLYNGVQLPPLPEWDKVKYPYAFIFVDTYGWTSLKATNVRPYYNGETMSILQYDYVETSLLDSGEWRTSFIELTNQNVPSHFLPFWTNFDLLAEDGSVYLSASAPIPVYA